ncbi:uncharacterized protein LOC119738192 isoform X2 [Patiria miniata]|uniref:BEN domain-containing protein n=1 Tax=Patiria miniata TaxID=46514 RepID=A0A914AYV5_PATMI|nr:uncharacterized protein LOC119738192 isoform X2 [Patiria miniata]
MFWGLTIEPGKHYTQTVEESFHVSMVALDTRDVAITEREQGKLTQLMVQHEKAEFLVCTLCYGTVFQQSLDLNLTEGEEVTFFTEGRGTLHLTGYLVKDEPLTLDPDMMSLEEMSSSDDVASDSGEWASGEESSQESPAKFQRPRQWLLVARQKKGHQRNTHSGSRPSKLAFVLKKNLLRRGHSHMQHPWRKKRKLSRIRANSYRNNEEDQRAQVRRSASSRHGHGLQEQRAILQTSDNVTATLILSETPTGSAASSVTTLPASQHGSLAAARVPGGLIVSHAPRHARRPEFRPTQDTVSYPTGDRTESVQIRTSADEASLSVDNSKAQPCIAHTTPDGHQPPDKNVLSPSPTKQQQTQVSLSTMESAHPDSSHVLPTQVNYQHASKNALKGSLKRKQPKSKSSAGGTPKRLLGSSIAFPHRKMYQRKVPMNSGGQMRQANPQWNVSLPVATMNTAGAQYSRPVFPDMVEEHEAREINPLFDGATSQDLKDNQDQHPLGQFPQSEDRIQPDRVSNTSQYPVPKLEASSPSQPISAEAQPGCSTQPRESYPPVSQHSLVPTSLAMAAAGPTMDTSSPGSVEASTMNNVYWSCMSDEPAGVGMTDPGSFAVNAGGGIPVASDIDFLTAEDMTCNGVNIGNQKLRLAHGYDVFISRLDLWEAEKASKKGWTILIRRLLDIYFDRMTLAMGKPTHHGNSMEYQPLDQSIIGAIRAFIKARYNIEKRKLIQAISIYCSDCRKSGIPGSMIENPKAMIFPEMQ